MMDINITDIINKSVLKNIAQRELFLDGEENELQMQQVGNNEFFNPNPIKLSNLPYKTLLENGYCVVSFPGVLGNNRANYDFQKIGQESASKHREFEEKMPSYLHLKKIDAGSSIAGDYIIYLFKDDGKTPICHPLRLIIK